MTTTKDHSTQNRYDIAAALNVPNERIDQIRQIGDVLTFTVNGGRRYDARVTKTGKLKKGSVTLAR